MLEHFTDEDIYGDLMDTGYLYLVFPDGKRKTIENIPSGAQIGVARAIKERYQLRKDGESPRKYRTLTALLACEAITCDDIRKEWRYHGVLLGAPTFCEKLVHDAGCACTLCANPVECIPGWLQLIEGGKTRLLCPECGPDDAVVEPLTSEKAAPHGYQCALCEAVYRNEKWEELHSFIRWCRHVIGSEDEFIILDTETTGFYGKIIEIAIIDTRGHILYDGLFKPGCPIEAGAMGVHHITEAMVASSPTIAEEWPRICDIVHGRTVITYNTEFDKGRIEYSLRQHGVNQCDGCRWVYECAMNNYANYWNAPPKPGKTTPKWQALELACKQQGLVLPTQTHRALGDCQMTLALLQQVAKAGEGSPRYQD